MFVQVIKGHTKDASGLEERAHRWRDEVRPGAIGFLGSTFGVAADGTWIIVARFADEAAAKANADRAEQSAWWEATTAFVDGEPTFRESTDVTTLFGGGSDDAGFVQVIESSAPDRAAVDALETPELEEQLRAARPDLLGGIRVWFPDNSFTELAYFTSESDARSGEKSAEFEVSELEYGKLFGEQTFTDLPKPTLTAARS